MFRSPKRVGDDPFGAQGYAVARVRFGRRLALFLVLIAVVPTLALIAILLFVSEDSQRGKADARLAAGLRTATAIYRTRTADAAAQGAEPRRGPVTWRQRCGRTTARAEQAFTQRARGTAAGSARRPL